MLLTNQEVYREKIHEGAILIRVMKSHIRFGTFEYVSKYFPDELQNFTDYVIKRHYPELIEDKNKYLKFYEKVKENTINMVVEWYRVSFIHGVMNTDNMSITGETFDYGPCSFMNRYDTSTTFSEIDDQGRYSFANQKSMLRWNLNILWNALLSLLNNTTPSDFEEEFSLAFYTMMKKKLGINDGSHTVLIDKFLLFLEQNELDYTNSFLELMNAESSEAYRSKEFQQLKEEIRKVGLDKDLMKINNPQRILRNYLVEEAIAEYEKTKSLKKINELLFAMSSPYSKSKEHQQPPSKEFDKNYTTHCNT